MERKQKRTCKGCKGFSFNTKTYSIGCYFQHKVKVINNDLGMHESMIPLEPCAKPKTRKEFREYSDKIYRGHYKL